MRTESISRRLAAVEAKLMPKPSALDVLLCQNEKFLALLCSQGLNIEEMKRVGSVVGALPRELLQQIVDRLKVLNAQF